jgi:hypothetical protein
MFPGCCSREGALDSLGSRSRITKTPYMALVLGVDAAAIRRLYDEVAASALESERALAAETHLADLLLLDALRRYLSLVASPTDATVLGPLISKGEHSIWPSRARDGVRYAL